VRKGTIPLKGKKMAPDIEGKIELQEGKSRASGDRKGLSIRQRGLTHKEKGRVLMLRIRSFL